MRHREALHDIGDGARLGAIALQEIEPRRGCGEEIAQLDAGSLHFAPTASAPAARLDRHG